MTNILLVENNEMNRDMISRRLERKRYTAAGCDDYDTRPVELPRLPGKIEALLNA